MHLLKSQNSRTHLVIHLSVVWTNAYLNTQAISYVCISRMHAEACTKAYILGRSNIDADWSFQPARHSLWSCSWFVNTRPGRKAAKQDPAKSIHGTVVNGWRPRVPCRRRRPMLLLPAEEGRGLAVEEWRPDTHGQCVWSRSPSTRGCVAGTAGVARRKEGIRFGKNWCDFLDRADWAFRQLMDLSLTGLLVVRFWRLYWAFSDPGRVNSIVWACHTSDLPRSYPSKLPVRCYGNKELQSYINYLILGYTRWNKVLLNQLVIGMLIGMFNIVNSI
jgi:hypothetical protein